MEHSQVVEYLKQCGIFYLATENGVFPRVRPMRHVSLYKNALYILVNKDSSLYGELLLNNRAEICTIHPGHSELTISCVLEEEGSPTICHEIIEKERSSLFGVCETLRWSVFRLTSGKALLTDYDRKKEEWTL